MEKLRRLEINKEGTEVNVFECPYCNVTYVTEDNLPISGQA